MNDTSPEIEQLQFDMMMSLGANRRIELACQMYMAARISALASLPAELSEKDRQAAFIGKMYGSEFAEKFFKDEL
ncbi:hypothetical protein BH10ACI2_BH10ACI2_24890 [soil metagenome]